ncbi:MAG: DUF5686 family protein [Candidatus Kapaibacterium sp.]
MIKYVIIILLLLTAQADLSADDYISVTGIIVDAESGIPLPGASVNIYGTDKGTYASSQGKFRITVSPENRKLRISSLGYKKKEIIINDQTADLKIELAPLALKSDVVEVTGEITSEELIKRAIERKKENLEKLNTFSGKLYSKLLIELSGSLFEDVSSGGFSIPTLGEEAPEEYKLFLLETFSDVYRDHETNDTYTKITNRRQTANLNPDENLIAVSEFQSFYGETIKVINAEIPAPLSSEAPDFYNYKIVKRIPYDETRHFFLIEMKPKSNLYPGFEGTIKIIDGSYHLVEADLAIPSNSGINFIRDAEFKQSFKEIKRDIWVPVFLEINGKAEVNIIEGMIDVTAGLKATGIYNEIAVNKELPDIVYDESGPRKIASSAADSIDSDFWEKNALREITQQEKNIYTEIDSLVAKNGNRDTNTTHDGNYLSYYPHLEFNRVMDVTPGIIMNFGFWNMDYKSNTGYSFGQDEPYAEIELGYDIFNFKGFSADFEAGLFSRVNSMSNDKVYSRLINTLSAAVLEKDIYDFYKSDGWFTGLRFKYSNHTSWVQFENSRQFALKKKTDRAIFSYANWRPNPQIKKGEYNIVSAGINIKSKDNLPADFKYDFYISGAWGQNLDEYDDFGLIEGKLLFSIPTFNTGFDPMMLDLMFHGGTSSNSLPFQYHFRMGTGVTLFGKFGTFYSGEIAEFGGTEFYALHLRYNLTDLWWRAIGLPLYEGRGIALILAGSSGRYISFTNNSYFATLDNNYSEVGFGLGRIPVFISNVIYLSVDFRWGIGVLSSGRFAWALGLDFPF